MFLPGHFLFAPSHRIHFIGIGGVGQRAAAELLLAQGTAVTGSDVQYSPALRSLTARGAAVFVGHSAANVGAARLVVVSVCCAGR